NHRSGGPARPRRWQTRGSRGPAGTQARRTGFHDRPGTGEGMGPFVGRASHREPTDARTGRSNGTHELSRRLHRKTRHREEDVDGAMERWNYHVAFTGNPGSGKTTVARIVAEVFHVLGIVSTPTVESVPASQLKGRYLGHTAANTHQAFDAAMGGVLFIDEAH